MNIDLKLKGLDKALLMFDPKQVRKAARMSINDGLTTGRKIASQEIRKDWNIKAARLNKELKKFKKANNNDLTAIIQAKGRPISLIHFGAKWKRGRITTTGTKSTMGKRNIRSGGGVTVQIRKGKLTLLPHAFIATTRAGKSGTHVGVFERVGRSRLPVQSKASVTVATMFNQPGVMTPTVKHVGDRMAARFSHHLALLIK